MYLSVLAVFVGINLGKCWRCYSNRVWRVPCPATRLAILGYQTNFQLRKHILSQPLAPPLKSPDPPCKHDSLPHQKCSEHRSTSPTTEFSSQRRSTSKASIGSPTVLELRYLQWAIIDLSTEATAAAEYQCSPKSTRTPNTHDSLSPKSPHAVQ